MIPLCELINISYRIRATGSNVIVHFIKSLLATGSKRNQIAAKKRWWQDMYQLPNLWITYKNKGYLKHLLHFIFFAQMWRKKLFFIQLLLFLFLFENDLTYPSSNIFSLSHLIFFFFFFFGFCFLTVSNT